MQGHKAEKRVKGGTQAQVSPTRRLECVFVLGVQTMTSVSPCPLRASRLEGRQTTKQKMLMHGKCFSSELISVLPLDKSLQHSKSGDFSVKWW